MRRSLMMAAVLGLVTAGVPATMPGAMGTPAEPETSLDRDDAKRRRVREENQRRLDAAEAKRQRKMVWRAKHRGLK